MDCKNLTAEEKETLMHDKVYKNITHSTTGKLLINTKYCRLAAQILGGDYDRLSKSGKEVFKNYLVFERLNTYDGMNKFEVKN